jgi:transposase
MGNCIGIDVAKQCFDLHSLKTAQDQRMDNSTNGIGKCLALCNEIRPELIVMEATGGYELTLAGTVQAEGFAVALVNPGRIRDFARAAGQIAKTDKLDARIIAQFAATMEPMPTGQIKESTQKLKALMARRSQLVQLHTAESNTWHSQLLNRPHQRHPYSGAARRDAGHHRTNKAKQAPKLYYDVWLFARLSLFS